MQGHRPALDLELGFLAGTIFGAFVALLIVFILYPNLLLIR